MQFIKQGSTWFNQRCWQDDYVTKDSNDWDKETYANSFRTEEPSLSEPLQETNDIDLPF